MQKEKVKGQVNEIHTGIQKETTHCLQSVFQICIETQRHSCSTEVLQVKCPGAQ